MEERRKMEKGETKKGERKKEEGGRKGERKRERKQQVLARMWRNRNF